MGVGNVSDSPHDRFEKCRDMNEREESNDK
jgi:hypothetical protein